MGRYCPPVRNSAIVETHCCNAIFFSKGFFFLDYEAHCNLCCPDPGRQRSRSQVL